MNIHNQTAKELNIKLYGKSIRLLTSDKSFYKFVAINYKPFITRIDKPDIEVCFDTNISNICKPSSDYQKIGSGLYFNKNKLIVFQRGLTLQISYQKDTLKLKAKPNFYIHKVIHTLRGKRKNHKLEQYQFIMRQLVHFPLFLLLRKNQKFILHSAAVTNNKNTFIFCGLNGVGKTTLALNFLSDGYKLLSDNFLVFDRCGIYPFPEVLRVPVEEGNLTSKAIYKQKIHNKLHVIPSTKNIMVSEQPIKPTCLFLVSTGNNNLATKLSKELFIEKIIKLNDYLKEFDNYSYISVFEAFASNFDAKSVMSYSETLLNLIKSSKTKTYLLSLDIKSSFLNKKEVIKQCN